MNKKIEKEWNKIKEFNILNSMEELEQLFISCPNGKCMRKYTAYPWSKENFFFGTAQDLLDWYKTTDEIPFFTNNYIDKKFGHLTITGFKRDKENNNDLIAICLCECGNIVELDFRKVRHGDFVSCGCKARKQKFISLYDSFKNIIDEKWDYNKNIEDPKQIPFDTKNEYWWKGYNHSYLMSPSTFFVKSKGTSFPEQAILYYLKQYFDDVESRYKVEVDGKKYEADIYLKNLKVAIEYDGYIWHKSKYNEDIDKTKKFSSQSIFVIRIRESGLRDIIENNCVNLKCDIDNMSYFEALSQVINEIFRIINKKFKLKINLDETTAESIKAKKAIIESQYLIGYEKDNIENTFLSEIWSDKNNIAKYKVSSNSEDKFYFKCSENKDLFISPKSVIKAYQLLNQEKNKESVKLTIENTECPFYKLRECPCNALYHENTEAPCKHFEYYGKLVLTKYISIFDNNATYSIPNIRTTRFADLYNKYIRFIKTIPNKYDEKFFLKLLFYVENFLFYRLQKIENVFNKFINISISENVKMQYLRKILAYPYLSREDVVRIFEFESIREFYFKNYNYDSIINAKESILMNTDHKIVLIDVLKNLIYELKTSTLLHCINIIKDNLNQKDYDKLLKSISIGICIKSNYKFDELKTSKKKYPELLRILKLNCSENAQQLIEEAFNTEQKVLRDKYVFEYLKERIENENFNREDIINLERKFLNDKDMFEVKICKLIANNKHAQEIYDLIKNPSIIDKRNKLEFEEKENFQKEAYKKEISSILNNRKDNYKKIVKKLKNFISEKGFIDGIDIDICELTSPEVVFEILKEIGFKKINFNLAIFDGNIYQKKFIEFIVDLYDENIDNYYDYINTDKMLKIIKNSILNQNISNSFKKDICDVVIYIQERHKRNSLSYIWVNDIDDFNELIGIRKKSR